MNIYPPKNRDGDCTNETVNEIIHRIPGGEDVTKGYIEEWVNNKGRNKLSDKEIFSAIRENNLNAKTEESFVFHMEMDWVYWNWCYST